MDMVKNNRGPSSFDNGESNVKIEGSANNTQMIDMRQKLNDYLGLIIKIASLAMMFGIVIGGISIYNYLSKINHLFLFSEVIGLTYASISALVAHSLYLFVFLFGFLSPFIINKLFNFLFSDIFAKDGKNPNSQEIISKKSAKLLSVNPKLGKVIRCVFDILFGLSWLLIKLASASIMPFVIFFYNIFFYLIKNIFFYDEKNRDIIYYAKFVHWSAFWFAICLTLLFVVVEVRNIEYYSVMLYVLSFVFILANVMYGIVFLNQNELYEKKLSKNLIHIIVISLLYIMPAMLHFIFVIVPTVGVLQNLYVSVGFYIFSLLIFAFSLLLSYLLFESYYKTKKSDKSFYLAAAVCVIFYLCYVSIFSNYAISLYKLAFIEKPKNSSWYLIHNGNTTSDKINGFDTKQINILKKEFSKSYQCTGIEGNILYGYMAWNLGNTKVFCPQSVDFFDNAGDNQEKSEKCLVIDGKYLQPISAKYVSAW